MKAGQMKSPEETSHQGGARRRRRWIVALVLVVAGMLWAGQAPAQEGVITLEESVIKGRIQKPEAFYILQHDDLEYESLNTKPSFLDELVETVEEEPF